MRCISRKCCACTGPASYARTRRSRASRARALARLWECRGFYCDHIRRDYRGAWPGFSQRSPKKYRPGTARQSRDFRAEDDADLTESNFGDEFFEALAMLRKSGCQAEIGINNLDIMLAPAEAEGASFESILQIEALLIG